MKRLAALALIPVLAVAQEMPPIVGTIPNRDNNRITFTTYKGECKNNDKLVYTQADGGQITATGCFRFVGDNLFVVWESGDIYSYPLNSLTLSSDMEAWLARKK